MNKITAILLFCIFCIAFGLRIGVALHLEQKIYFPDAQYYDRIADNVIAGEGAIITKTFVANRMPLYPYILAFIKTHILSQQHYVASVRVFQSFLSALLVIPVYFLVCMFVASPYGLCAALLIAFDPLHILLSSFLLTETTYSFCLTLFIWGVLSFVKHRHALFFLLSVISCVSGMYIKESMFHILVLCVLFSFLIRSFKGMKAYVLTLFIIAMCALSPWVIRNYDLLHEFVPFTTNAGVTLYDSVNPHADGGTDVTKFSNEMPEGYSELEKDVFWKRRAFEEITKDPLRMLELAVKKFKKVWNVIPNAQEFRDPRLIVVFRIYYIPLLFFFFGGVCVVIYMRTRDLLIVSMPIIYGLLLHVIIIGSLRYRMPMEPFVIVLAMIGLERCMRHFNTKTA